MDELIVISKFQRYIFGEINLDNYINYLIVKNHQNFYVFILMIVRYLILDQRDFLLNLRYLKMSGKKYATFTKIKTAK